MTTEEFRGNLREYLTISIMVGLGLLLLNWRYGLGWLIGNGLFYLNLFLRNWFYTTILHYRLTNAMLFVLYSVAQLLLISIPIIGALTTHWFNVFTLLLGYLFYKFYFVYFKTLKKGRNG